MRNRILRLTARVWAARMLLVLTGCAPRAVPTAFPLTSAASPRAVEAPQSPVAIALREEPPLPGEPTEAWTGLAEPSPSQAHHAAPTPPSSGPAQGGTVHAR